LALAATLNVPLLENKAVPPLALWASPRATAVALATAASNVLVTALPAVALAIAETEMLPPLTSETDAVLADADCTAPTATAIAFASPSATAVADAATDMVPLLEIKADATDEAFALWITPNANASALAPFEFRAVAAVVATALAAALALIRIEPELASVTAAVPLALAN
jgi:hypothetical protein